MFKVADLFVGKRLFVGSAVPSPVGLGIGPTEIRGSGYIEGPLLVGSPISYTTAPNVNEANLMVARCTNIEALPPPLSIFKVSSRGFPPTPIDVMIGDPTGIVGITVNSMIISIFNATNISIISPFTTGVGVFTWVGAKILTGVSVEVGALVETGAQVQQSLEVRSGAKCINGASIINGAVVINGALHINGFLSFLGSIVGIKKKFDISHPTKPNHRLTHVCIEGPEAGVYYRGKLKDSNVIELPDYWRGLVHAESITVNLTPHGCYQELFVKEIECGIRIIVMNNSSGPIDCSYTVFGKRKDIPDIVVEYEGNEIIDH